MLTKKNYLTVAPLLCSEHIELYIMCLVHQCASLTIQTVAVCSVCRKRIQRAISDVESYIDKCPEAPMHMEDVSDALDELKGLKNPQYKVRGVTPKMTEEKREAFTRCGAVATVTSHRPCKISAYARRGGAVGGSGATLP